MLLSALAVFFQESTQLLTKENEEFIKEVVQDRFYEQQPATDPVTLKEWSPKIQRTGVIARKIGVYPLWLNNGQKIAATLLQVLGILIPVITCLS